MQAIQHAKEVRERLRNPPNAVRDDGIDLKREKFRVVQIVQEEPVIEVMPVSSVDELSAADALERAQQITLQMQELNAQIERMIAQSEQPLPPPRITVAHIQKIVATRLGVSVVDLQSGRRDRATAGPRQIAMYLAKTHTVLSLPQIGRLFGGRDHTTVLFAVRKIKKLRQENEEMRATVGALEALLNVSAPCE